MTYTTPCPFVLIRLFHYLSPSRSFTLSLESIKNNWSFQFFVLLIADNPMLNEATTSLQLLQLSSLKIISSLWGIVNISSYQHYHVYSSFDILKPLYEGESIIIRNVCLTFIKTRIDILQVHHFSTYSPCFQCTLSITAQSSICSHKKNFGAERQAMHAQLPSDAGPWSKACLSGPNRWLPIAARSRL
jgi:hypothetical protein